MITRQERHNLATGLAFLAPNIFGFFTFTLIPLILSLVLAFSNYDLRLHNRFRHLPLHFTLFENFSRLFSQTDFWRYLGNTLFLMLSVPFGIAGSLATALLRAVSSSPSSRTPPTRTPWPSCSRSAATRAQSSALG